MSKFKTRDRGYLGHQSRAALLHGVTAVKEGGLYLQLLGNGTAAGMVTTCFSCWTASAHLPEQWSLAVKLPCVLQRLLQEQSSSAALRQVTTTVMGAQQVQL